MKLYELTGNLKSLEKLLELELTEEEQKELIETILSTEGDFKSKVDNTVAFMKSLDMYADGYSKEIKRLQKLKQSTLKTKENLKEYLIHNFKQLEIDKIQTERFKITLAKSKGSLVLDEEAIPEEYCYYESVPNSTLIKTMLERGEELDFAHIELKSSLRVT